jgi:8-oxo-dGTP pyrophosphatase MutT (NUDIX family)
MSAPTEPLHPAVEPRPASTTLVVRDGPAGLDVLMVRRSPQASFMPGAYVFPGGAVDGEDAAPALVAACDESPARLAQRIGRVTQVGDQALAYAVAALRECFEECGLWLGAATTPVQDWPALRRRLHDGAAFAEVAPAAGLITSALVPWSHWVTPVGLRKRFDTLFFVAPAPPGQVPEVDAGETTTLAWVHPPAALAAYERGEFPMEFATLRTVESLLPFAARGSAALIAHAASQVSLPPVHPRLRIGADGARQVLLPGEPGYDEPELRR